MRTRRWPFYRLMPVSAAALQNLQDHCAACCKDAIVLSYFFDITDRSHRQNMDSLVSSLLCQLALQDSDAAAFLSENRVRATTRGHTTLEEKTCLLLRLLRARHSPVYILVDALDESDTKRILPALKWLKTQQAVSLLVSARTADDLESLHGLHVVIARTAGDDYDIDVVLKKAFTKPDGILAQVTNPRVMHDYIKRKACGK